MLTFQAALLTSVLAVCSIANPAPMNQPAVKICAGVVGGIKCLANGSRFVNCNGDRSVSQAVADGQVCKDGQFVVAGLRPGSLAAIWKSVMSVAQHPVNSLQVSIAASTPASTPAPAPAPASSSSTPAPSPAPASETASSASSASSKAPDPCLLGGQVLASDMQDDSCKGADGSIECRTEYMYVRCNAGKIPRCRTDKGHKCFKNKLSNTYQA